MATVINNPPSQSTNTGDSGVGGFLVGLIVLILLAILLFAYGLPALRRSSNRASGTLNVNVNHGSGTNTGGGGSSQPSSGSGY